ncbi:alpha-ketoglutarate-dependent dioxygenase AlkB family protein [Aliidiomarina haloalkalitolerans]|uniref:Alpha-ketoglutarate-dependent dioxygenase AlkB n=1 Tax=Aliidiomarina haloalkalitolerans TaxID=859059 RepID=A0A432VZF2_9GAMM|nr:alpha-ketoglutarate-dependent dioxygenase AlkB [Aliidiomarina haloalkalitolerans]RUO22059.1 alpha-ketoglutarate-dependent dioxygenase AlkB [Aliidiomarina haloalkalitolerans]
MQIDIPDGQLFYYESWLEYEKAWSIFAALQHEIDWEEGQVFIFGRWHSIPRLQAWYGEPGLAYTYSGKQLLAKPWTPALHSIKRKLETCGYDFNSVLLNLYRDGSDKMGWHRDNERELGHQPVIASISLGAEREFQLRHKGSDQRVSLHLTHGSLLIMAGETQANWYHQLPQRKRCKAPRINLTFRSIITP